MNNLAPDLVVTATSLDGRIPEMVEHRKYPNVLGVQFHPERGDLVDPRALWLVPPQWRQGAGRELPDLLDQSRNVPNQPLDLPPAWMDPAPREGRKTFAVSPARFLEVSRSETFHQRLWAWLSSTLRENRKAR